MTERKQTRGSRSRLAKAARPNPGRSRVMIGTGVLKILYTKKGMPHDCDPECKAAEHEYVHTFDYMFPLWGVGNGERLEI